MKWFSFEGRATRKEWWVITLVTTLLAVIIVDTIGLLMLGSAGGRDAAIVISLLLVPFVTIYLFASVRRYHDLGKSGWWALIAFIPLIGLLWQLVELGFIQGAGEENAYGSSERAASVTPVSDSDLLEEEKSRAIGIFTILAWVLYIPVAFVVFALSGMASDSPYSDPNEVVLSMLLFNVGFFAIVAFVIFLYRKILRLLAKGAESKESLYARLIGVTILCLMVSPFVVQAIGLAIAIPFFSIMEDLT